MDMFNLLKFINSIVAGSYFQIIISAFFGGLFAGIFANYFESKRRIVDKRFDKYYDHRNTIVRMEHELLPARVNISRNINSLEDSFKNTSKVSRRIVLRFFKLKLSPDLNLNLLNLELINLYADVFSKFETINNDIDYINQIASSITEGKKKNEIDENLIHLYYQFAEYLLSELKNADSKSLELVCYCKFTLTKNEKKLINSYIKNGGEIDYNVEKKSIENTANRLIKEETRPVKKGEPHPNYIAPYLDMKLVELPIPPVK